MLLGQIQAGALSTCESIRVMGKILSQLFAAGSVT